MLNSIRNRLLAWFIAFMLLTAGLIIPANLMYHGREKKISQVAHDINTLYIDFLRDTKFVNDFITTDPENANFFIRGESPFLISHQQVSRDLYSNLLLIRSSDQIKAFGISGELNQLARDLNQFNVVFDSLVYLVYKRGYRNFGLEGELSDYAGLLENAHGLTNRDIYHLRKIENEYFISKDTSAVSTLKNLLTALTSKISRNQGLSAYEKSYSLDLVQNYAQAFLRLVELDSRAGIRRNIALRSALNETSSRIEGLFKSLSSRSALIQKTLINRLNLYYVVFLFLILLIAVFFSYKASKHVVSHLEALTNYISALAKNNLEAGNTIDLHNSAREIKQIYREFRNLLSQLRIWEKQRDSAIQHADDNQQRYRELADLLPQSVFETDSYGNYTYVNRAWYQSFGFESQDLQDGLNLIETLVSESDDDILSDRKIENSTFLAIRKNGSKFPASVYTDNIVKNNKIAGRRGIIIDITDRVNYIRTLQQETSRARTSDELKSSFLANMSHEIRTPMNSIIGFSNLLASEHVPDTQKKDFTHYIQSSSEILLNLVDDIIDIAKIEAGELKIVKKDFNLNALGSELLTTSLETRKRLNKDHLQLTFKNDTAHAEIFLKTDPFRLRQVMINLINNALKFTDKGSVEFGFSVRDETEIEFYVKDTGPGLTREELDMIFERFKRGRRSEEKNIVGTGLGLAIAKNLVQLLGGQMWVDSTAGKGTAFLFTIPYLRPTLLPSEKDNSYGQEAKYNWHGKKILIVEDDANSMQYVNVLLKRTQAEILHTGNGEKAVEMVNNYPVDLVFMDIRLPMMDGLEATRLIKKSHPRLPVIAQTAYAMAGDKEKMKLAGCDDYLPKPLDPQRLLATLNHHLFTACRTDKPFQAVSDSRIITN